MRPWLRSPACSAPCSCWAVTESCHVASILDCSLSARSGSPVPARASFRYCASAEDYFVRQVAWCDFRDWETATAQYIADGARDCGTSLDIGAHTGIYALLVATLSPETRVLAFEPEPRIFPALVANLELNGFANVSALQIALSDRNGEAQLAISPDRTAASLENREPGAPLVMVRTARADDLVDDPVGLVKIDVEGHEMAVLRGMAGILERDHPALVIECFETLDEVRAHLAMLVYRCRYFGRSGLRLADGRLDPCCSNFLFN